MKQKIVIKMCVNGNKSRSKVLKIAVSVNGVESVALQGQDKNQLEVIGNEIDSVQLIELIRKHLGFVELGLGSFLRNNEEYAELLSVNPVEEKKEEKKEDIQPFNPPFYWSCYPYGGYFYPYCSGQ